MLLLLLQAVAHAEVPVLPVARWKLAVLPPRPRPAPRSKGTVRVGGEAKELPVVKASKRGGACWETPVELPLGADATQNQGSAGAPAMAAASSRQCWHRRLSGGGWERTSMTPCLPPSIPHPRSGCRAVYQRPVWWQPAGARAGAAG